MSRPTLASLAKELGVSAQTVSNVLNAPERVRPATRDRIMKAIRESGYQPSAVARAMRSQTSLRIGLRLFPGGDGINGALRDVFLHALVERAEASGYRVLLFTVESFEDEREVLTAMHLRGEIDGAVLTDTTQDDPRPAGLQDGGVPFVAFGRDWGNPEPTHAWVDVDGAAGTAEATEHLLGLGHRRIGFLGWPEASGVGDDRLRGWVRVMSARVPDVALLDYRVHVKDTVSEGAAGADALLARGATALVCASDSLAIGALDSLRRRSLAATDAFAPVIGFDDTPVARALGISSLAQPMEETATVVVDQLLGRIRGEESPDHRGEARRGVLLPPRLQLRRLALGPHQ